MRARWLALALLSSSVTALAQPMIDPSKMSGIPRPDPEVPPGVLTVRVLRGDFAHPLVGQVVTLEGQGGPYTQKVDESDHAVFKDLALGATYVAKATAFGTTLESQPVTMPEAPGVKMMLVFPKDEAAELGEADGKARSDARLAVGTLAVKVVDGDDKPLADVPVVLSRALDGGKSVDEQKQQTGADGVARFSASAKGAPQKYTVKAMRGEATVESQPFNLDPDLKNGVLVALRSIPLSHDPAQLQIANGSHFIIEVRDDDVQVLENLIIDNSTGAPFDPGPKGLRLPLADGATGAQLVQEGPMVQSPFTVEGTDVVLKGRLPTGTTELRVGFFLPIDVDTVVFRQTTPIPFLNFKLITDHFDGMSVDGNDFQKEVRKMSGRSFWLIGGNGTNAGGQVYARLTGLPHANPTWRYVATAIACLLVLWGLVAVMMPRRGRSALTARARLELESKRIRLLNQVVAIDQEQHERQEQKDRAGRDGKAGDKAGKRRDELLAELERVYHQLDEDAA